MSPTSYQAAPPRVIDTTPLAALPQLLPLQLSNYWAKFPELSPCAVQNAPSVRLERERRCSEWLRCCRVPKALTPQTPKHQREADALRTCAGTCADGRPQLPASCEDVSSTQGQHSTACRSSCGSQSPMSCQR